jgi:hypothetical protein
MYRTSTVDVTTYVLGVYVPHCHTNLTEQLDYKVEMD